MLLGATRARTAVLAPCQSVTKNAKLGLLTPHRINQRHALKL
jgi:hypothetical protein